MSNLQDQHVLRQKIEIEVERKTEEKTSKVVFLGLGTGFIAYVLACIADVFFGVEISLFLLVAAATPVTLFYTLWVVYIRTIEHNRKLRFGLMDEGIQI